MYMTIFHDEKIVDSPNKIQDNSRKIKSAE